MKIKWKVSEKSTGPYAWVYKRSWPSAFFNDVDQSPAAQIVCTERYSPSAAKTGDHAELKVLIADHTADPWKWCTLKKRCATLAEAKALVEEFYKVNQGLLPKPKGPPEHYGMAG